MTDRQDPQAGGSSFLDELKRRKVVRVASVYAAVSYAVVEVADLAFPRLQLPDWSVTLVLVLALVGFPLTLVGAWVFELREGALARTSSEPRPAGQEGRSGWLSARAIVAVAALVGLGAAAGWLAGRGSAAPADQALASIGVLPFADMSPSGDMEYFGDGMAEEILNVLSRIPDLKVAGRTSSFSFKGKDVDLREIGAALEVGTIVEGSIRRSGSRIRITAQLIRAADQSHLWSRTFDRGFDEDVFAVQEEIALAIVDALQLELGGAGPPSIADQRGTDDLEAYDAYLLGRFRWGRRTRDDVLGSIPVFEEAIRLDPRYARAYTGIADAYSIAGNFGWMRPADAFPRAREAVERALEIDPDLPDAHTSLGAILSWYEWDQEAAEREFRTAIELGPNLAFARYWYALVLDYTNRRGAARAQLDSALITEPLALQIRNGVGNHLQWWGETESAIAQYRSSLEIDPGFHNARWWLATALLDARRPAEALAALDSLPVDFLPPGVTALRGWAYAQLGRTEDARSALAMLNPGVAPGLSGLVRAYAELGDVDGAFRVLDAAVEVREYNLLATVFIPRSDPLRTDPRFDELLARIGLQRYWP